MKNNAEIVLKSRHRHIYFCLVTVRRAAFGAPEKAANAPVFLYVVLHKHKWCPHAKTKILARPVALILRPEPLSIGTTPTTPMPREGRPPAPLSSRHSLL